MSPPLRAVRVVTMCCAQYLGSAKDLISRIRSIARVSATWRSCRGTTTTIHGTTTRMSSPILPASKAIASKYQLCGEKRRDQIGVGEELHIEGDIYPRSLWDDIPPYPLNPIHFGSFAKAPKLDQQGPLRERGYL